MILKHYEKVSLFTPHKPSALLLDPGEEKPNKKYSDKAPPSHISFNIFPMGWNFVRWIACEGQNIVNCVL